MRKTSQALECRFRVAFHVHGEGFKVPISPQAVMSEQELENTLGHIDRTGGYYHAASRKEPPYAGRIKAYVISVSNHDRRIMSDKGFAGWINTLTENGHAEDWHPPIPRYKEPRYIGGP